WRPARAAWTSSLAPLSPIRTPRSRGGTGPDSGIVRASGWAATGRLYAYRPSAGRTVWDVTGRPRARCYSGFRCLRFEGSEWGGLMKGILVALAAAAVLSAVPLSAEESLATAGNHLVTADVAQARLLEAGAARERNLATVESFLASPAGQAGMGAAGVTEARVRGALPTLSDAELQDVA